MSRRLVRAAWAACCGVTLAALGAPVARAGVTNPDISVVGQPFARWTDDPNDLDRKRATLNQGELETVFDAYLNPYAKGYAIVSLAEDGISLEEGYFSLLRGLPADLQLKGGKYRVGFGKLNPMHPHQLPFADRPRVLAAYLPGEESFNETGISLSERIPLPGTFSLTATADWLQGDSFRIPREPSGAANDPLLAGTDDRAGETRAAFLGALSGFGQLGDRSGYEVAVYATGGTNNVAAGARTYAYNAAGKLKVWTGDNAYFVVQGELLKLERDVAGWDSTAATYVTQRVRPLGGYAYLDWNFSPRWDAGVSYERYERPTVASVTDHAVGAFVGLALMEETTSFRLDWNHYRPGAAPGDPDLPAVNTVTMRVIFAMGPHKAHQF